MINAKKKWDNEVINGVKVKHVEKVLDIKGDEPCWVVGTVYCEMKYKPNVLDEVSHGINDSVGAVDIYTDPEVDEIMLEDESGRILIEGELLQNTVIVTGTVVGFLGMESQPGTLKVVDIAYPFLSGQKPTQDSNSKIAIVSGLKFNGDDDIKYELLKDFLTGELPSKYSEQISRLIIAGNSILIKQDEQTEDRHEFGAKHKSNYNAQSVAQLDSFLLDLLPSIPIDLMPGESDPAETSLPQQPLHKAFFHKAKDYLNTEGFRTLTNPTWLQYDELKLLGTSGENINDIYKYVLPNEIEKNRISILEATIMWQNIIPTAPDTLWCYPFPNNDPFTLTETPHVYFVGNQPSYETKLLELEKNIKIRLVTIPEFKDSGEIVILDTKTLETEVFKFE